MAHDLALVTFEYPYGSSETFLEAELHHLAEAFREVVIVPTRGTWSLPQSTVRDVPSNATIFVPPRGGFPEVLREAAKLLGRASLSGRGEVRWPAAARAAAREAFKAAFVVRALRQLARRRGGMPFAYSFWKTEGATALAHLTLQGEAPGFVTRCHGIDLYDERLDCPVRPYDPLVATAARAVAPISEDGLRYLLSKRFPGQRLAVHRLGARRARNLARHSTDGILRIVSCSSLIRLKRVERIAQAVGRLKVPFEWVHFGDGPERQRVAAVVAAFPASGSATLRGQVSHREVLAHYASRPADVFVNFSTTEGLPVSIMEALAHGIPCIATDVGGTRELVDDRCGMLLDESAGDERLTQALADVAMHRERWVERRAGAVRRWSERIDADRVYARFARLLLDEADTAAHQAAAPPAPAHRRAA